MIEKISESIRTDIQDLESILKLLDSPALKKILIDQNGDCESQIQLFEQIGDESKAQSMREIDKRIKQAFSEHDSMQVTDALPSISMQIRSEIESLELALKLLDSPALKKILIDQNGDCESQAQLFEQIGDESRAQAMREIDKRLDQFRKSRQSSSRRTLSSSRSNQNSSRQTSSSSRSYESSNYEPSYYSPPSYEYYGDVVSATVTVQNRAGIHARPASLFVGEAAKYKSTVKIKAKGKTADAKSILMIMGLGLSKGTEITITADGEDAGDAVHALVELVESKFGGD